MAPYMLICGIYVSIKCCVGHSLILYEFVMIFKKTPGFLKVFQGFRWLSAGIGSTSSDKTAHSQKFTIHKTLEIM